MFRRERFNPRHESQPSEALRDYNERLRLIADGHERAMGQIADSYDQAISTAETVPKLEKALGAPEASLKPILDGTTSSVTVVVGHAAKERKKLLTPDDQAVLAKAQAKAQRT